MSSRPLESNLLVRLGIVRKEDVISNLIADLLLEPSFLDRWLEFAGLPLSQGRPFSVKTRVNAEGNIPDLAVLVGDEHDYSLLVIENKVLATEGEAQTKRYSNLENIRSLGKAFGIEGLTRDQFKGLYLSLHDEGTKDDFQIIRYAAITAWLRESARHSPDPTRRLFASDLAELIEFFHEENWTADDRLQDVLQRDPCGLGKNFVAFQKIFSGALELLQPAGSVERGVFYWRGSGLGHSYYGGVIETDCASNGWYQTLDHTEEHKLWSATKIDFQYEHQANRLKLVVHYETSPYKSQKKQAELFRGREQCLTIHLANREAVRSALKRDMPDGWRLADNFLQIAAAKLDVKAETTIAEFQGMVRKYVDAMIPVLDNAWKEVRA